MRLDSSKFNTNPINTFNINNKSYPSSNSSSSGSGSRRPASALSKIAKHVPPPISPIISLKSTTTTSPGNISKKDQTTCTKSPLIPVSSSTNESSCAWRLPKANDQQLPKDLPTSSPSNNSLYPQRKVPALAPEPEKIKIDEPARREKEKEKGFLERIEEFPDLLKLKSQKMGNNSSESTISAGTSESVGVGAGIVTAASTATAAAPSSIVTAATTKLLGGDFNFLNVDDWLDGDNIDYSQNLFENDNHFLPSYILNDGDHRQVESSLSKKIESLNLTTTPAPPDHVKAKTLLAERCHSSKKKDIWKRITTDEAKLKIKILKRPDQVQATETFDQKIVKNETKDKNVKKFSTGIKIKTTEILPLKEDTKEEIIISKPKQSKPNIANTDTKPAKIVYSSASKTLQKL